MKKSFYLIILLFPFVAHCFPLEHEESEAFRRQLEDPSIGQFITNSYGTEPFYQLRLTEEDTRNIRKLIKNMADLNLWSLLGKIREMNRLGDKVNPVHPLRFIGFIYSSPDLKKRMPKIQSASYKWGKFVEGYSNRMAKEHRNGNLTPYVPGFCQLLGVNPVIVNRYIELNDWEGILHFFNELIFAILVIYCYYLSYVYSK